MAAPYITGRPFLMTRNFKSYRVRAMLECGHVVSYKVEYPLRVPPEWIRCEQCKAEVMVYAFETREWKVRCGDCRYSRWSGQSEDTARELQTKHFVSKAHKLSVRYTINPEIFEIIRHHYRRHFQFRIPDVPPSIRFPKVRNRDSDKTDIPPF